MRSPSESPLATTVIDHLADMAAGRCSITDEGIAETARTDPVLAEILTALLFLHEDLALHAAQRDRALAGAEAANRELDAFGYSVAHDLRVPLLLIDSFSEMLAKETADELDEDGRAYLGYIRESAQTMAQIIDDLMLLSHAAQSDLRRERVDLSALVRTILDKLKRMEPKRRLEAVIQDDVVANGDARLLRVVMDNIVGNAWKYTSRKRVGRIEFGARADTHPRVFFVRDNGAGFDATHADELFLAFRRLHAAEEFSGTGIGLATVRRIVRRHGGRVWAEGEVDRGATFYFTLEEQTRG